MTDSINLVLNVDNNREPASAMHVRPVIQADLPDFARVCCKAMWDDEIMAYTAPYKNQHPDSFYQHCLHRVKLRFYRGEFLYLCVSDEEDSDWTGKEVVIGYCGYSTTVKGIVKPVESGWLGNSFEMYAGSLHARYAAIFRMDRSADPVALAHFRRTCESPVFEKYFMALPDSHKERFGDQHWELEILGTHPEYRRRGVGKLMLQEGLRRASRDGVPLVLVASVTGEKLYLSVGFDEVNRVQMVADHPQADKRLASLDLGQGSGKGMTWAVMAWEPESMGKIMTARTPVRQGTTSHSQ